MWVEYRLSFIIAHWHRYPLAAWSSYYSFSPTPQYPPHTWINSHSFVSNPTLRFMFPGPGPTSLGTTCKCYRFLFMQIQKSRLVAIFIRGILIVFIFISRVWWIWPMARGCSCEIAVMGSFRAFSSSQYYILLVKILRCILFRWWLLIRKRICLFQWLRVLILLRLYYLAVQLRHHFDVNQ